MIVPLVVLAIGALGVGLLNVFLGSHDLGAFLAQSPSFVLGYDAAIHGHGSHGW